MTQYRSNQFAVGLFVLAGLATLFMALALLTGRTGPADTYYTMMTNVAGIKYGTPVVYEGFPIGQVESVAPDSSGEQMQFRLALSIRKDWQIPTDSQAIISMPGVLAAKTILITGGKENRYFSPGDTLPSLGAGDMFAAIQAISRTFADLSRDGLLPLINNLNTQVSSAGELIRGDLQSLVGSLEQKTPGILNNVETFTHDLAEASRNFDAVLTDDNAQALKRIIENADKTSGQLAVISEDINKLLLETRPNLKAASDDLRFSLEAVAEHIDSLTHNLDAASLQLLEFSRQIRNNPGTLIRGTEPASGEEARGPGQ